MRLIPNLITNLIPNKAQYGGLASANNYILQYDWQSDRHLYEQDMN